MKVEAYEALRRLKHPGESFSDVVLRITSGKTQARLSDKLEGEEPDEELASQIEEVHEILNRIRLR